MSVEDLGTRELGQVRSQRLDEVSFFCPFQFIFFVSTVVCFYIPYSWVRWYTLHGDEKPHPCRRTTPSVKLPEDHFPQSITTTLNFDQIIF
jgi:hypothetical protein